MLILWCETLVSFKSIWNFPGFWCSLWVLDVEARHPWLPESIPKYSRSECRSDWRWTSLQPRKPLKLKAAWTGKSSIIFRGFSKVPNTMGISKQAQLTGVLEFVTVFPWLLLHRVLLFWGHDSSVGKTSMLLLWFQCLMTCRWRLPGGSFSCVHHERNWEGQLSGWKSFAHWFHSTITYSVSIFYVAISICFSEVGNVSAMRWS